MWTTFLIRLGRPRIGVITLHIESSTSWIWDGKLTHIRNYLKSQFRMMISPLSSLFSHSRVQLYHHLTTQSSFIALYLSIPWSTVSTEYIMHRVQHTRSKEYTNYSIHWVLHTRRTTWSHDRLSPAAIQSPISLQTMVYSTLCLPTIPSQPMKRVSAPGAHPSLSTGSWLTASKYTSILGWLCPPSPLLDLHDYSLCIATLSRFRHPCSHHDGLQVHLRPRTFTPAKCIVKPTRSQPLSLSPISHDYSHQTLSITASSVYFV
jgi:hypothetical protein